MSEVDLSSPEAKAAIEAAVEKATAPLVAKRDELLGEVKKLRKGREIDPAELEKLEAENDALKGQLNDANKAAKTATRSAEEAVKKLADAEGYTTKLLADNGLTDALAKAGVTNPALLKAAKALHATQVQIVADGESRVAKVGDKGLADFITEWAGSDEGKHFVTAAAHSGMGSKDSKGGGAAKTITTAAFNALRPAERAARMADGYTLSD